MQGATNINLVTVATKNMSIEETAAALATTGLSEAEQIKILRLKGVSAETAAAMVETYGYAASEATASTATTGLTAATTGLKVALNGLKVAFSNNPIGFIATIAITAITILTSLAGKVKNASERLEEISNTVKDNQNKIDDLNGELETTKKRIEELERKPNLTIVEQNELDRLKATNDELERQIELEERKKKVNQGKAASEFTKSVELKVHSTKVNPTPLIATGHNGIPSAKDDPNSEIFDDGMLYEKYFEYILKSYQYYNEELGKATDDEKDTWQDLVNQTNEWMSTYVGDLRGYLDNLGDYDYETLSDDAKKYVDYIYDVENAYLMASGDNGKSVFSNIYNQERFAEGKKAIESLKESGELTAKTFEDLYNSDDSVKAMIDNMQKVGIINDTTADTFNLLTNQILGTKSAAEEAAQIQTMSFSELISGESVQDTIDSFKTKLATLSEALKDFHNGDLSDSDLIDLFKEFPELANRTDDLGTALNELINSTQIEIDNQFDSWQKSMPTNEDAAALNAVKSSLAGIAEQATGLIRVTAEIEKLNSALDNLQSTYSDIQDVIDDYNDNGYLTLDNLQSIMDLEPEYINLLIDENGQINLNNQAYKDYVISKAKSLLVNQLSSLYESILAMTEEEAQAYANAMAFDEETRSINDLLSATTKLYIVKAQAKDAANGNTTYMDALTKSFSTAANYAAIVESYINSLGTSQNEFTKQTNNSTSALEAQKEALEKQKDALEDEKEALNDAKEALEDYKDALEGAQDDIQSLIDLVIDYIKQIKEDEKKALEEQIDRLEKQKDALDEQKDKYAEVIDKKKEALRLAKEEKEAADELAAKQKTVAKSRLALEVAGLDDSSAGRKAQKQAADELSTNQKDLNDFLYDQAYEKEVDALDKQQEKFEETIEKQKKKIDKQIEHIEKQIAKIDKYLNNTRRLYIDACRMIDDEGKKLYNKLWKYVYKHTSMTKSEFNHLWSSAQTAIKKYQKDNESLEDVMEKIQNKIYSTDKKIASLSTQIGKVEGKISKLDTAISNTSDAINSTGSAIGNVSSNLNGLSTSITNYIQKLKDLAKAQEELEKKKKKKQKKKKYKYKYMGKTYKTTATSREKAISNIIQQIKKDYNGKPPIPYDVYHGIQAYATGTRNAKGGLSITQEQGLEAIFGKLQRGQYTMMPQGSQVFTSGQTDNLFDFSSDPQGFVKGLLDKFSYANFFASRQGTLASAIKNISTVQNKMNGDTSVSAPINIHIQGDATQSTVNALKKEANNIKEDTIKTILHYASFNKKNRW